MQDVYCITAFYQFASFRGEELFQLRDDLIRLADEAEIIGLVILASEGMNATVAGKASSIDRLKEFIRSQPGCNDIVFKDSSAPFAPFRRFRVKLRDEIVTLNRADLVPSGSRYRHLPPKEWHRVLREENDFVLLDTRNVYETEIGKFRGAYDPRIHTFQELGEAVSKAGIPKDKKVLMYCTGGIRCEKAILELEALGYENVYQLEGGILKYLEEFPDGEFEGECFVFDHRVAVDSGLRPSTRYRLCPHCGNPADVPIVCEVCGNEAIVSKDCSDTPSLRTCSKNCAYHHRRNS